MEFQSDGGFIRHVETNRKIGKFQRANGVYRMEVEVEEDATSGFSWPEQLPEHTGARKVLIMSWRRRRRSLHLCRRGHRKRAQAASCSGRARTTRMTWRSTVKWCLRKILKRHFPLQLVVRDPGAPTEKEIAEHSVTHLPHRSWCPICVQGRARSEHALPELHFDHVFLGTRDESETQAIQVMRDTKTGMMFAHHVPKKAMSNVHGAREIIKDVEKLEHDKITLRSNGEAAL